MQKHMKFMPSPLNFAKQTLNHKQQFRQMNVYWKRKMMNECMYFWIKLVSSIKWMNACKSRQTKKFKKCGVWMKWASCDLKLTKIPTISNESPKKTSILNDNLMKLKMNITCAWTWNSMVWLFKWSDEKYNFSNLHRRLINDHMKCIMLQMRY